MLLERNQVEGPHISSEPSFKMSFSQAYTFFERKLNACYSQAIFNLKGYSYATESEEGKTVERSERA